MTFVKSRLDFTLRKILCLAYPSVQTSFVNLVLLAEKQYLYSCRQKRLLQSIKIFDDKIKMVHSLEKIVTKSNNKLTAHNHEKMEEVQ